MNKDFQPTLAATMKTSVACRGLLSTRVHTSAVEVNHCLDLVVFILHKRVLPAQGILASITSKENDRSVRVAVGVIVGQGLESLRISSFAYKPTRRFRRKEDEGDLQNGRKCLQ